MKALIPIVILSLAAPIAYGQDKNQRKASATPAADGDARPRPDAGAPVGAEIVEGMREVPIAAPPPERQPGETHVDAVGCLVEGVGKGAEAHHVVGCAEGGSHALDNLESLCVSCHDQRHDRTKRKVDASGKPLSDSKRMEIRP